MPFLQAGTIVEKFVGGIFSGIANPPVGHLDKVCANRGWGYIFSSHNSSANASDVRCGHRRSTHTSGGAVEECGNDVVPRCIQVNCTQRQN